MEAKVFSAELALARKRIRIYEEGDRGRKCPPLIQGRSSQCATEKKKKQEVNEQFVLTTCTRFFLETSEKPFTHEEGNRGRSRRS